MVADVQAVRDRANKQHIANSMGVEILTVPPEVAVAALADGADPIPTRPSNLDLGPQPWLFYLIPGGDGCLSCDGNPPALTKVLPAAKAFFDAQYTRHHKPFANISGEGEPTSVTYLP